MRRWHRSMGAGSGVFVVFLVLSGLALNHSHRLGLDRQVVTSARLLRWYGLGEPDQLRSFAVDEQWLSFAGSQLYLNDKPIASAAGGVGAIASGQWLVAASGEDLLLFSHTGELIERLPWGPPGTGQVEDIGRSPNGNVVIKSSTGFWLADAGLLHWSALKKPLANTTWSAVEALPTTLRQAILQQYRGRQISLERVLLDLHSGRIFGAIGVLVYDLLAMALGTLALSGLVLWWRGRRNGRRDGRA